MKFGTLELAIKCTRVSFSGTVLSEGPVRPAAGGFPLQVIATSAGRPATLSLFAVRSCSFQSSTHGFFSFVFVSTRTRELRSRTEDVREAQIRVAPAHNWAFWSPARYRWRIAFAHVRSSSVGAFLPIHRCTLFLRASVTRCLVHQTRTHSGDDSRRRRSGISPSHIHTSVQLSHSAPRPHPNITPLNCF